MKRLLGLCLVILSLLAAPASRASFHLFVIDQIYSNADGTVQFIVLSTSAGGQEFVGGHAVTATGPGGTQIFNFPSNLPGDSAGHRVLIATSGFAALGIVTPDYVVPNKFVPLAGGTVNYAGVSQITYTTLPTDGVNALYRSGIAPNVATNFAGNSASVQPAVVITPQVGNWSNPAEQGTGYAFDFKHGVLVVVFFSFQTGGAPQWYIAQGPITGSTFTGTLDKFINGQCITASCPFVFPMSAGNDGVVTIDFTSNTAGTMHLPGGRSIPISPTVF